MGTIYSNIVPKKELRTVQQKTLNIVSDALIKSFGPEGSTTCIKLKNAFGKYTKDGHTILKNISFSGPVEAALCDDLEAITRRIVTTIGDGTTSAVVLSSALFTEFCYISDTLKISDHKIAKDFKEAISKAICLIRKNGHPATLDDIYNIAYISSNGNANIAELIKDIYEVHGMEVFIDVKSSNGIETLTNTYDGFTIDEGLADTAFINTYNHTCELRNPNLYIFEDPIDTDEMSGYLSKIIYDNIKVPLENGKPETIVPTVVFTPKIGKDITNIMDEIIKSLSQYNHEQRRDYFPINIVTNINDLNYLYDLAYLSGARLIKKYIDPKKQKDDQAKGYAPTVDTIHNFAGKAELCITNNTKTKIINPKLMRNEDGSYSDLYLNRLHDMEAKLEGMMATKESTTEIGLMKRRINSFKANMVDLLVGGISETDRDELIDLVEDSVLNCRSAAQDGVGFGANFEAFKVFNYLLAESEKDLKEDEIANIVSGKTYNIYHTILTAYFKIYAALFYDIAPEANKLMEIISNMIKKGCPLNIRTKEYDGKVLSSIKTDIIILEAIAKIMTLTFETNQFLTSTYEYNTYVEPLDWSKK